MPGRLTTISTGSALRRANERFANATWDDIKAYLDAVEANAAVTDAARNHGVLQEPSHVDHHDEFIGNGAGCFFPQFPAELKNDIMRAAMIQAMRVSLYRSFHEDGTGDLQRDRPLPIVSYWITGAQTFEAYVDRSATEVHIFLVTPDPAPALEPPTEDHASDEPMWVCAAEGEVQAIRERAPQYAYRDPVSMPAGLRAVCQQVKSY